MKTHVLVGLTVLALVGGSNAAAHHHRGGHHDCSAYDPGDCACPACGDSSPQAGSSASGVQDRNYDPDSVTTLRGTATAVTVVPARGGRSGGLHLTLETDGKPVAVHLGPSWFLERQGLALAKGDAVEVTGSLVEQDGTTFLIARELKKGAKVVTLRDARGVPAWSGGPGR